MFCDFWVAPPHPGHQQVISNAGASHRNRLAFPCQDLRQRPLHGLVGTAKANQHSLQLMTLMTRELVRISSVIEEETSFHSLGADMGAFFLASFWLELERMASFFLASSFGFIVSPFIADPRNVGGSGPSCSTLILLTL